MRENLCDHLIGKVSVVDRLEATAGSLKKRRKSTFGFTVLRKIKLLFKRIVPFTDCKKCELDEDHCQKDGQKNQCQVIRYHIVASIRFEIAFDEFLPQVVLLSQVRSNKVIAEIHLFQVLSQFVHADLSEVEGQGQRLSGFVDWNAVFGQVAE